VQADATVQIGSFGGVAAIQTYQQDPMIPIVDWCAVFSRWFELNLPSRSLTSPTAAIRCTCAAMDRARCGSATSQPVLRRQLACPASPAAQHDRHVLPEEPHSLFSIRSWDSCTSAPDHHGESPGRRRRHPTIDIGGPLDPLAPNVIIGGLVDPRTPNVINSIARVVFPTSAAQGVTA